MYHMRGSRQFSQKGSNFEGFYFFWEGGGGGVDAGRKKDPDSTISRL